MIIIDTISYNIPIEQVVRTADFLDKYAERTADGELHRELIGVYFNYKIVFGRTLDVAEYALLWLKLTEPVEFHDVIIPNESGDYEFTAYFAGVGDELVKSLTAPGAANPVTFWKSLSVNFISKSPARIPA